MLIGQIPSQLRSLKKMQILSLDHNNLEGPIPIWLGGMTSLVELSLGSNQLTGEEMTLIREHLEWNWKCCVQLIMHQGDLSNVIMYGLSYLC